MDILIVALLIISIFLLILLLIKKPLQSENRAITEDVKRILSNQQSQLRQEISANIANSVSSLSSMLNENQRNFADTQSKNISEMDRNILFKQQTMNDSVVIQLKQFEQRLKTLEQTNEQKLEAMRDTISKKLSYLQDDNNKKLDEIRNTVDEKLQKTLEEKMTRSFQLVSERLEEVYKGLGEMQTIASGVGDLKKVLSNVKTRGILGEIQLGAILQEILTPEQYETEFATVPNSTERVEFAIKLPGSDTDKPVYLPIDSKFPGDTYAALQDAYQSGDTEVIKTAYKNLEIIIKKSAKDIRDKYISVPNTTNFAIMFLPFEGLYAEVVNHGLVEVLQRDYSINIAGPSTMAAMLNSLQMGFKTLQIQKRSGEVWQVLGAVKTEFTKFETVLSSAQNRIRQLDADLDKLVGVRTRGINRKLRDVELLEASQSDKLLEIED